MSDIEKRSINELIDEHDSCPESVKHTESPFREPSPEPDANHFNESMVQHAKTAYYELLEAEDRVAAEFERARAANSAHDESIRTADHLRDVFYRVRRAQSIVGYGDRPEVATKEVRR